MDSSFQGEGCIQNWRRRWGEESTSGRGAETSGKSNGAGAQETGAGARGSQEGVGKIGSRKEEIRRGKTKTGINIYEKMNLLKNVLKLDTILGYDSN